MDYQAIRLPVLVGLIFLFVIGTVTWLRMIKRDTSTDRFARQRDLIRQRFKVHFDKTSALADYEPFRAVSLGGTLRRFGGLCDTVAVLNGFLAAGLMAALILSDEGKPFDGTMISAAIAAVLVGVGVTAFQVTFADNAEQDTRTKLDELPGMSSHAGGIVYRMIDGKPHYLLVSATHDPGEWVLPKGHVEPGEDEAAAALREVGEETGVVAAMLGFAGCIRFRKDREIQNVKFFLMHRIGDVDPARRTEVRRTCWLPIGEAVEAVSYEESRAVLRLAEEVRSRLKSTAVNIENSW